MSNKQYTTPEQTAKLIEFGFEKPKNTQYIQRAKARNLRSPFIEFGEPEFDGSYSIGELIEMLPTIVDDFTLWIGRDERSNQWFVKYHPRSLKLAEELIDALYEMVMVLKEEGVI